MTDLCCRLLGTNYHGLCFTRAKLQKHSMTSNVSHHIASHVENLPGTVADLHIVDVAITEKTMKTEETV